MKSSGRPMVHVGKHKSSSNSCFLSVTERMRSGSSLTSFGAARSDAKARRANLAAAAALLLTAAGARAEEHVAGFANLSEPQSATPLEDWGPVPTDKASIANLAPCLLPFFNNGPVFGLPGTVTGDFWDQTQLTGDWDGVRTEMTRGGLFIDLYLTSAYQDVTSGGLKTGPRFCRTRNFPSTWILAARDYGLAVFSISLCSPATAPVLSKPSLSALLSRNITARCCRARCFPMTPCRRNIILFRPSRLK